jgi:periplasmic copper chaperone A
VSIKRIRPRASPSRAAGVAAGVVAASLTTGVLSVATAPSATAHVTIDPGTAEPGGFGRFAFRVPNERPVPTRRVEVNFPAAQPLPFVSVRPTNGWTFKVDKVALTAPLDVEGQKVSEAVTRITWTGSINPGEFQEFDVSIGPLPKSGALVFKALQTYADGQVVRWIEAPQDGGPPPERPAPVLKLTAAANAPAQADRGSAEDGAADGAPGRRDGTARVLGAAGLAAGLAALVLAGLTWRRRVPAPNDVGATAARDRTPV